MRIRTSTVSAAGSIHAGARRRRRGSRRGTGDRSRYRPTSTDTPYFDADHASSCLATANFASRRAALQEVGGFSPAFLREEDRELQLRLWAAGKRGLYSDAVAVTTEVPVDRLTKAYHRNFHARGGRLHARMRYRDRLDRDGRLARHEVPAATLLGSPGFMYRSLFHHVAAWLGSVVTFDWNRAFFHETRVLYFASYIWHRFRDRGPPYGRSPGNPFASRRRSFSSGCADAPPETRGHLRLFYYRGEGGVTNFGDELNRYLWPHFLPGGFDEDDGTYFVGIGTLLNDRLPPAARTVIFGAGVGYYGPPRRDGTWDIYCVRGPLSARALGLDADAAVTDPAALITRIERHAASGPRWRQAFMPHWQSEPDEWARVCAAAGIAFIDPRWYPDEVLDALHRTDVLVTEAMHGAIVADALRIPWIPVRTRQRINQFKWEDWCQSVGVEYRPHDLPTIWPRLSSPTLIDRARRRGKLVMISRALARVARRAQPLLSRADLLETACTAARGSSREPQGRGSFPSRDLSSGFSRKRTDHFVLADATHSFTRRSRVLMTPVTGLPSPSKPIEMVPRYAAFSNGSSASP